MTIDILEGNNLEILNTLQDEEFDLIYIDPPFNTGKKQTRRRTKTTRVDDGGKSDRTGFKDQRYSTEVVSSTSYNDKYDDYLGFLEPRLKEAYRLLSPSGSFFLHIDPRESHYCKIMLDSIFGRSSFMNEIIWAYDYGGRSKKRWSAKHDTIFWYAKNPKDYTYNYDAIDRRPYMAPGLVGKEKAARGKTPTDVWWNTIVPTNGKEKVGYTTQKPLAILNRIVKVHSNPGDKLLDFFAGSGTTGHSAALNDRNCLLVDSNPEAIAVMHRRLKEFVCDKEGEKE
jgi:site-specific DNA-methyltransferase (adenine-specific)